MEEHQMIQGLENAARLLRAGKTLDKEQKDALAQALGLTRHDTTFSAAEFWQRAREMTGGTNISEVFVFGQLAEAHVEDLQMRISYEQERGRELVRRAQEAEGKIHSLEQRYQQLAKMYASALQERKDADAALRMAGVLP